MFAEDIPVIYSEYEPTALLVVPDTEPCKLGLTLPLLYSTTSKETKYVFTSFAVKTLLCCKLPALPFEVALPFAIDQFAAKVQSPLGSTCLTDTLSIK